MRNSKITPSINAGSMADIAFLLLLFFLATSTIENDQGIAKRLPDPCPPSLICDIDINERNVLRISLNKLGEMQVENESIRLQGLQEIIMDFVDNNGDNSCGYCVGDRLPNSSDNPLEATIAIKATRDTPYKDYISVQDKITGAYSALREKYALSVFKKNLNNLSSEEFNSVKDAYPHRISEAAFK